MEPIILASSSPRRQEILTMLGIPFRVIMPNIDETVSAGLEPEDVPELLAREKVSAVLNSLPPEQEIPWVLGADTVIIKNGRIFGKPENQEQAERYLRDLQGGMHTVITALVLYDGRRKTTLSEIVKTRVTFSLMTGDEIRWYAETGEWHGAAGGYRIQGLASCFIKNIDGSQSCVAGLPIQTLYAILKKQGYSILE